MSQVLHAALASWSIPWLPTIAVVLTALTYLRGWYLLRCAGFALIAPWRVWMFLLGLFSVWVALASPMDVFNGWLLTAHMLQHMVLMMIAPPLILLGAPLIPLVRGLPILAAREFAGPFLNWRAAQRLGNRLTQPVFALVLMSVVMLGWHIPALYELALRSGSWHQVEHACFLVTSLIFWWPVVRPWPSEAQWPRWSMVPYLLIADLVNTVLSAILVFADRVLYPSYLKAPAVFGLTPRQDQAAAGALMWVVGSAAFLIPAMPIAIHCLGRPVTAPQIQRLPKRRPILSGAWQRALARLGISSPSAEAVSFLALFLAMGIAFSTALAFSGAEDDQLALRARQQRDGLTASVYASPGDLPTGGSEVNVLVQDAEASVVFDSDIQVSAAQAGDGQQQQTTPQAHEEEGENKLMKTFTLELPRPGHWIMHVDAQHDSQNLALAFPVNAAVHQPGFGDWWPYLLFPATGVLLLTAYVRRSRRHRRSLQDQAVPVATSR